MKWEMHRIQQENIEELRALSTQLGRVFEDPESYCDRPPSRPYSSRLLGLLTFIALVACQGTEVVGGLVAYELPKFEKEHSEIYLL